MSEERKDQAFFERLEGLRQAKNLREEADYYNRWSKVGCENLLHAAREFLEKAEAIIEKQGWFVAVLAFALRGMRIPLERRNVSY
jgi:hypothetical protein